MRRVLIIAVVWAMLGVWGGARWAMGAEESNTMVTLPQTSLEDLYKKLDTIQRRQDDVKNVAKQLDQVLKNQARILEELDIVKVRASRK